MNICIISWDNLGYISLIEAEMRKQGNTVNHLKMNEMAYVYPNVLAKTKNAFTKTFLNYNVKKEMLAKQVREKLNQLPAQDMILIVSADWLPADVLPKIKEKTANLIAWFYDAHANYPGISKVVPYFDRAFTFEKKDAARFNIGFLPNFNPYNTQNAYKREKPRVFHISSHRKNRQERLTHIASQLKELEIPYEIYLIGGKPSKLITVTSKGIPLDEVHRKLEQASIQIDLQRERQQGLSFRIFEAMGLGQKVITTNQDIVNYDFYNPHNHLIMNEKEDIDEAFFLSPYQQLSNEMYQHYTLENWVKQIISAAQ